VDEVAVDRDKTEDVVAVWTEVFIVGWTEVVVAVWMEVFKDGCTAGIGSINSGNRNGKFKMLGPVYNKLDFIFFLIVLLLYNYYYTYTSEFFFNCLLIIIISTYFKNKKSIIDKIM
jgi:hypothetical protein